MHGDFRLGFAICQMPRYSQFEVLNRRKTTMDTEISDEFLNTLCGPASQYARPCSAISRPLL